MSTDNINAALTQRRLRQNRHIRELSREVRVSTEQFIQPLFVVEGLDEKQSVPGLSGVNRETPDSLIEQIEADLDAGISKFLLFGVPLEKHLHEFNFSFTATQIQHVKKHFGDRIWLAVDVCLCSSTEHGHCGILNTEGDHVLNGDSVVALGQAALEYAQAGADCVAPSDMMDGRIASIRKILDNHELERTILMSYAAKFHSGFYGPFRIAADSTPTTQNKLNNRASYQIDPAHPTDALQSAVRDADEGADILMVKPGMPYLDIVQRVKSEFGVPTFVYQVSGEYAMLCAASQNGWLDHQGVVHESLLAFKRAGADAILTYFAEEVATALKPR